jgi:pimeloyl-ACP methyl ester carboxylesterase
MSSLRNTVAETSAPVLDYGRKSLKRLRSVEVPTRRQLERAVAEAVDPAVGWSRKSWKQLQKLDLPDTAEISRKVADAADPVLTLSRNGLKRLRGIDLSEARALSRRIADAADPALDWSRRSLQRLRAIDLQAPSDLSRRVSRIAGPAVAIGGALLTRGSALAAPIVWGASHAASRWAGPAVEQTRAALQRGSRRRLPVILGAAGVAVVAGAVLANLLAARAAERKHPPRGKFIEVDGVRLHYLEKGQGPTIVLLHGEGVSAEDFRTSGLYDRLAETHRVIAIDRPGFGYSTRPRNRIWSAGRQAELIHRALGQIGVQRPLVVGHGLGALVALNLGLEHPDALSGLVLMSGYYHPSLQLGALARTGAAVPILGDALRWTLSPLLARALAPLRLRRGFSPAQPPADAADRFPVGLAARPSQIRADAADAALLIPSAAILKGRHGDLRVPTLVMGGGADRVFDWDRQSRRFADLVPGSRTRSFGDAGHLFHHLAPEETAEAIAAFADRPGRVNGSAEPLAEAPPVTH